MNDLNGRTLIFFLKNVNFSVVYLDIDATMTDLKMLSTTYKKAVSSRPWETRAKHAKQRKIQLKSRPYWRDFWYLEFSFADDF